MITKKLNKNLTFVLGLILLFVFSCSADKKRLTFAELRNEVDKIMSSIDKGLPTEEQAEKFNKSGKKALKIVKKWGRDLTNYNKDYIALKLNLLVSFGEDASETIKTLNQIAEDNKEDYKNYLLAVISVLSSRGLDYGLYEDLINGKNPYLNEEEAKKLSELLQGIQIGASNDPMEKIGNPMSEFQGHYKDTKGRDLKLTQYRGKALLVNFWASWCGACKKEMPNVIKTYNKYKDQGFEVLGISLDDKKSALDSYLKEKNITWRQFFDGKGWKNDIAQQYNISSIPATFLLDKKGIIRAVDLRGELLEKQIEKILKEEN